MRLPVAGTKDDADGWASLGVREALEHEGAARPLAYAELISATGRLKLWQPGPDAASAALTARQSIG